MKRSVIIASLALFVVFSFMACGPKAGIPVAGSAKAEDMLTLVPKDASAIMVIDVGRAMQTEPVSKMLAKEEASSKLEEFVKETGIDIKKDVYFIAGGLIGSIQDENPDGALVINAKFNKDTLLAKIKEKGAEVKESVYEGITVYEIHEPVKIEEPPAAAEPAPEGEPIGGEEAPVEVPPAPDKPEPPDYAAFLDASNVAVGTEPGVKAVIDVLKKKQENVYKNADMAGLVKQARTSSLLWAVVNLPPDFTKKAAQSNPMLNSLEGIHAMLLSFDYKDKAIDAEIKAQNKDEAKNKQMAEFLTGLKAMGGMIGGDKPSLGELLNKIEVASGADFVSIKVTIPQELLARLAEDFKDAMPKAVETPQETPEESQETDID